MGFILALATLSLKFTGPIILKFLTGRLSEFISKLGLEEILIKYIASYFGIDSSKLPKSIIGALASVTKNCVQNYFMTIIGVKTPTDFIAKTAIVAIRTASSAFKYLVFDLTKTSFSGINHYLTLNALHDKIQTPSYLESVKPFSTEEEQVDLGEYIDLDDDDMELLTKSCVDVRNFNDIGRSVILESFSKSEAPKDVQNEFNDWYKKYREEDEVVE